MADLPAPTSADLSADPVLDLPAFSNDDAVDLGLLTVALVRERGLDLAVRVELRDDVVFLAKTGTTGVDNDVWLEGKAAAARHFGEASLLVRLRHEEAGTPFVQRDDVDHDRLRAHGGAVPLRVAGEIVGTLTTSGEPDHVDHATTVEAVRRFLASRTA